MLDKLAACEEFINNVKTEFETKPQTENPSFTIEGVEGRIFDLKREVKVVFSAPKPKAEPEKKADETEAPMEEVVEVSEPHQEGTNGTDEAKNDVDM